YPVVDRARIELPGGNRLALLVYPNIEHFDVDKPTTAITPATSTFQPDALNAGWRDYGNRVGIWRLMEVLDKHGVNGTPCLNSHLCSFYARIIEEGNSRGWEWIGHGRRNTELLAGLDEETERSVIKATIEALKQSTGKAPKGWLGPFLTETY